MSKKAETRIKLSIAILEDVLSSVVKADDLETNDVKSLKNILNNLKSEDIEALTEDESLVIFNNTIFLASLFLYGNSIIKMINGLTDMEVDIKAYDEDGDEIDFGDGYFLKFPDSMEAALSGIPKEAILEDMMHKQSVKQKGEEVKQLFSNICKPSTIGLNEVTSVFANIFNAEDKQKSAALNDININELLKALNIEVIDEEAKEENAKDKDAKEEDIKEEDKDK